MRHRSSTRRDRLFERSGSLHHQIVTTVLGQMKEGIVCEAPDGRILDLNTAAARMLGISRDGARGATLAGLGVQFVDDRGDRIAPDAMPARAAFRGGQPIYGRPLDLVREGEVRHLSVDAVPVSISTSRRVISVYHDITHLLDGRAALRDRDRQLDRLIAAAPVGIGLCDGDSRLMQANPPLAAMLGRKVGELKGCCLAEWVRSTDPDQFKGQLRAQAAAGSGDAIEASVERPDGEVRELRFSAASLGDDGSPPFALYAVDVSEGRKANRIERMLARASDVFSTSIADFPDRLETLAGVVLPAVSDVCLVDLFEGGEISRVLAAASEPSAREAVQRLGAFPLSSTRGPIPTELRSEQAMERSGRPLESLDGSRPATAVREAIEQLDLAGYVTLPMNARGELVGMITFARTGSRPAFSAADVGLARAVSTRVEMAIDNARLYRLMERALQARERLLAIVSHDLRSPIGTAVEALNFLQMKQRQPDPGFLERNLSIAERSLRRAVGLIDDLMDLRRRDRGTLAIHPQQIHLPTFIDDLAAVNTFQASADGITLRRRTRCEATCTLIADPDRLHQVFANLIGNAIKNTPRGGRIRLIAISRPDSVLIAVSDSGTGMTDEQIEHMLEWGWQARADDNRGMGIGLAVVKMIVEAHGGRVLARRRPSGGMCIHVVLPRDAQEVEDAVSGHARSLSLGEAVGLQSVPRAAPLGEVPNPSLPRS